MKKWLKMFQRRWNGEDNVYTYCAGNQKVCRYHPDLYQFVKQDMGY